MNAPDPRLSRLIAAHRRVHRPDPALRATIAAAVARDRQRESVRRWVIGSATAIALAAAALVLVHWVAGPNAAQRDGDPTRDAAAYGRRGDDAEPTRATLGTGATPARAPAVAPSPPPPAAEVVSPPSEPTPRKNRPARAAGPAPTATTDDGTREVQLLRAAEVALANDPRAALALLREHQTEFPASVVSLEREALFILALCETEAAATAAPRLADFLRRHPGSAYAARVQAACAQ